MLYNVLEKFNSFDRLGSLRDAKVAHTVDMQLL